MRIIKQTDKEKIAMYMKVPKKKLAEMLIQCNKVLDAQYGAKVFSSNAVLSVSLPSCKLHGGKHILGKNGICFECGDLFKRQ